MKQLVIPRYGPPEVLTVREAPDPAVTPGAVRIRVHAAGVNFADLLARQGLYPDAPNPPCVLGYEVAGVVDLVGAGVVAHQVGDRVIATTKFGGQSELVVVPAAFVFPLPEGWSFEEGAALPVVYLTAHHMLVRVVAARAGETVLVHAAAGGVGLAVAELARIMGLRVIGLASPAKHDVLRSYGVEPLDARDARWPEAVRRVAPGGVDIVLDAVGGDSWRHGYALLAPLGRLVCYGVSELSPGPRRNLLNVVWKALRWPRFAPVALMNANRAVAGVNLGRLWGAAPILGPQLEALLAYARAGRIRPRVDRTFPLAEGAAAHRYIHERRNIGKVVLTLG
ncbi:MAG TPA: medium chain dehydrogenase/reductase family protein [Gemmatimonadales bacterium]|nr:medium chain dehydrogenase/reductase family protein [Gemmatimonadales bacterium]